MRHVVMRLATRSSLRLQNDIPAGPNISLIYRRRTVGVCLWWSDAGRVFRFLAVFLKNRTTPAIKTHEGARKLVTMPPPMSPCMAIAVGHIEVVMQRIDDTLNPQGSLKEEVSALRDVYLNRKNILLEIDAKHTTLRHQKRLVAREGAARRVRIPKTARPVACGTNSVPLNADNDMGAKSASAVPAARTIPASAAEDTIES